MPAATIENDNLLDLIYFGVSDSDRWRSMLGEIARHIGAREAFSIENGGDGRTKLLSSASTPSFDADWYDKHGAPHVATIRRNEDAGLAGSPSCRVAAATPGENSDAWLVVTGDASRDPALVLNLREDADEAALDALRMIAPHLLRGARLRRLIDETAAKARSAMAVLDLIDTPVFLITSDFRIVQANSATRELEKRGVVQLANERLRFASRPVMERVKEALDNIGSNTEEALLQRLIRFEQPNGYSLLAVIEPLDALFSDPTTIPDETVAAIFLKDPQKPVSPTEAALREMHDMPPAEARFAAAFGEGLTYKEYAEREGLSESYVRNLSKRVMSRLGIQRQADLVRAIVSITPKIGG